MVNSKPSDTLHPSIVSELKVRGAAFQIVDYHWDAGADIVECEPDVMLRWRVWPYRIKTRPRVQAGESASFGQLMLHPANVPTLAEGAEEGEDVRTLLCRFDREWLNDVTGTEFPWERIRVAPCFDLRNGDIDHAMRRLMRELIEPGFASTVLAESLGVSMAVDIMRFFEIEHLSSRTEPKGSLSSGRLRQIQDYVESFNEGCPTLSDVAHQCNISVAHLRRLYKASTGRTLHDFIEDVRVRRAKSLLLDSNLPLKVISYKLGFCHPSAFSFAFKKLTGEAPREFRHRCSSGLTIAA